MKRLSPTLYAKFRQIFAPFDYSLSVRALMEGASPGHIFVDDPDNPRTALALTIEGYLLVGDPQDESAVQTLRQLFIQRIFTGQVYAIDDENFFLAYYPDGWESRLADLIPTHQGDRIPRYHYLCRQPVEAKHTPLPEGYQLRKVNQALLGNPSLDFPRNMIAWIDLVWGGAHNFIQRATGYCVQLGDQVVAWCTGDCSAGGQLDVGVFTLRNHQRRGLAAAAARATAADWLANGGQAVGWHCDQENIASWKTAEKAGFQRMREYTYYYYIFDQADNLAQLGWSCYKRGEYQRTADYYQQVFELKPDCHDYYYHLAAVTQAALGDYKHALVYLQRAVEQGWDDADFTQSMEEFEPLHGDPQWKTLLARMRQQAN